MRALRNDQTIAFEVRLKLSDLEIIIQSGTGEHGHTLRRFADALFEVTHDPHEIFLDARALLAL